ncbi:hypothetical protein TraAM80_09246 [Trypanosoma rangeli]|uniref:Uncharacterized protein n=1 Tax=Trypanosoma rangeli TaxID=5698 RepID=A0A422MWR3_TRYRA|nr:uncharacterized protein TraAM80_09246 [Trypanosoma rangeli]RNE97619.1 hypothetical protein TraAM80_09246 [Trypanosoma rangeli]|eukprot:RNE97619.1 hypothetical protein TraAM80_09246 [Trypanosoma rangeli]
MQFVVVDGAWPVVPCAISRSQLLARAVRDSDLGEEGGGRFLLPGSALVTLCQEVLDACATRSQAPPNLKALDVALLHAPHSGSPGALCLYAPTSVGQQRFAVEDLAGSECLLAFTAHRESLISVALLSGVRPTHKERDDATRPSARRPETRSGSDIREVSGSKAARLAGRSVPALRKFTRAETYFTSVASTTQRDFAVVNELLLLGTIRVNERVESFVCSVCGNLPWRTMTTSCCGAVVCAVCAPTLSSSSVLGEEVVCAVCGEVPLTNPEAHVSRDAEVMRLVRELRVLYRPQLSVAACRTLPSGSQPPPTPFTVHHAGLPLPLCDTSGPTASVLGSLFLGSS